MVGRTLVRRRAAAWLLAAPVLLTGCQLSEGTSPPQQGSHPGPSADATPTVSVASVSVTPRDGAKRVRPDDRVHVSASSGRLTRVAVTTAGGDHVDGRMGEGGSRWTSVGRLDPDTRYSIRATAADERGLRRTTTSTFRTLAPAVELTTAIAPLDGETVGVGMPVQVQLSSPVTERAAVERALTVETTPEVTGSWHWVSDDLLRYRPKRFWEPGTEVAVHVDLTGIDAGGGVWGAETRDVRFSIGEAMVSVVDDATQTLRVRRNGDLVRTIAISDGADGFRTRRGIKVLMLKHRTYDMNSSTIGIDPQSAQGYDLSDVPYAMRLTNSGEFLHAAPWNAGKFGRVRASHGCIGMSIADARWLFEHSLRGDVVRVTGSPAPPPVVSNGYGGWNLTWSQWQDGSALDN